MYIGDITLASKNEKEQEAFIETVWIYNQDIGIEFGLEKKCHAHHEKREKRNNVGNRTAWSRKNQRRKTTITSEYWKQTQSNNRIRKR